MNKKEAFKLAKDSSVASVAEISLSYKKRNVSFMPTKINDSSKVYKFFMDNFYDHSVMAIKEYFYILLLNRRNNITSISKVSEGGINGTVVDVRLIVTSALLQLSSGVIAIHNHPTGNTLPSESDKAITKKIKDALNLVDVKLLDHLIISEDKYYSLADEGDI